MTHLTLQAVTKRFNAAYAVDHVDLSVPDGKLVSLLGPSGCGKTTLLRMIAGLETPTSGSVTFAGRDITHVPASRRDFGMVFQSLALFPHMTVAENIAYPLRLRKTDKAARTRRIAELLELIQLPHMANRPVTQLSGGQRQRVAIARAIASSPKLLLLDEPLSALDPFLRVQMRAELKRWQQELGFTFVHVTHSQEEAMALADQVVVMNHGRIEQNGSPREVFNAPRSEFVARFMGAHNVIATPAGKVAVRSDRLRLQRAGANGDARAAAVRAVEYQGTYVQVSVTPDGAADDAWTVTLPDAEFDAAPVAPGDSVFVSWAPAAAHTLA
jgi:putative spermidine/putrescine transport system ATP-binding protein